MSGLSMEQVEREYVAWEQAAVEASGGFMMHRHRGHPRTTIILTCAIEGDGSDLPDDYGIEPAEDERLVHTGWACGFVGREAVTL